MAGTDVGGDSSVLASEDRAAEPPPVIGNLRAELAAQLFRGSGIEIGALHLPMLVPPGVRVRYVDRMTVSELRAHYPELEALDLAPVDVVDDGEGLLTFEPESVDFIVANHFLEHCEDPIRTIGTHLSKLRPGGTVFYAVPDKRYTFDFRRPRTRLSHVIADHEDGGLESRGQHYLEYAQLVYPEGVPAPDGALAQAQAAHMEATNYSIHFHVWTQADLLELVLYCQAQFGSFDVEAVRRNGLENIVVLRKHGEQVIEEAPPSPEAEPGGDGLRTRTSALRTRPAGSSPSVTVPLSALRMKLDEASTPTSWAIDPDGVKGRALVQPAGSVVTIPLRLAGDVAFSTRVRLLPHDWRDGVGALRAWVAVTDQAGTQRALWSGSLPTARMHEGNPSGMPLDLEVPASSVSLRLGVDPAGSHSGGMVARAAWIDPRIGDPAGTPAPASGSRPHPNGAARGLPRSEKPLISVLTPVHNPPLHMLEEAIASVRAQAFSDWELCLVDDGSTDLEVSAALERHAASDHRIHLRRHDTAGGISAATNAALDLATGEYIALLDHDDTLAPHALQRVADQIALQPDLDMIYSDEDIVMDGQQIWLHLKPAWSLDTLRTNGYTCHLGVYRRALVNEIGGFRSEFDGSQDVDMILRLVERTDPDCPHPGAPLPLADPRRLHGRGRRKALCVRGRAQRDRGPPRAVRDRSRRRLRPARALSGCPPGRSTAAHRTRAGSRRRWWARGGRPILALPAAPCMERHARRTRPRAASVRQRATHRRRRRLPCNDSRHRSRLGLGNRPGGGRRDGRRRTPTDHADPRHRPDS